MMVRATSSWGVVGGRMSLVLPESYISKDGLDHNLPMIH